MFGQSILTLWAGGQLSQTFGDTAVVWVALVSRSCRLSALCDQVPFGGRALIARRLMHSSATLTAAVRCAWGLNPFGLERAKPAGHCAYRGPAEVRYHTGDPPVVKFGVRLPVGRTVPTLLAVEANVPLTADSMRAARHTISIIRHNFVRSRTPAPSSAVPRAGAERHRSSPIGDMSLEPHPSHQGLLCS